MVVVCFLALSVSLPMAFLSLAKVMLFVTALGYILGSATLRRTTTGFFPSRTVVVILATVALFSMALLWTQASSTEAATAFVKHAKVLEIVLILALVRTPREAATGLGFLLFGQAFAMFTSWLMAAGITLPWVLRAAGPAPIEIQYVPYADSYLDQSIMFVISGGIFWHLGQGYKKWRVGFSVLAAMLLVNVCFLMPGRTGYVIAIVAIVLATSLHPTTRNRRWARLAIPAALILVLALSSSQFYQRSALLIHEFSSAAALADTEKSTTFRLAAWYRSIQAIQDQPWIGFGTGGWPTAVRQVSQRDPQVEIGPVHGNNPHQQFLLLAVEFGLFGPVLLLALFWTILTDAAAFSVPLRHAIASVGCSLFVASLFNSALYDDLLGDYICVTLGLLLAMGLRQKSESPLQPATASAIY